MPDTKSEKEIATATLNALATIADALPPEGIAAFADLCPERDAYSIEIFCRRHSISRTMYYALRDEGKGPDEFILRGRVLISKEAAAAWRKVREQDAKTEPRQTRTPNRKTSGEAA